MLTVLLKAMVEAGILELGFGDFGEKRSKLERFLRVRRERERISGFGVREEREF